MASTTQANGNGSAAGADIIPVILWCVPRSVSTATERAFMTRQDTRCWHEPLGDPFYFSSKRQSLRYSEEECKASGHWDKDIVDVMKTFLSPEANNAGSDKKEPIKYVFVKDMAQYIIPQSTLEKLHAGQGSQCYRTQGEACGTTSCSGASPDADVTENPTVIPTALMRRFKHAFLVRTPEKAVPSYYKCCQDKMAGFEFFDAAEAGFEELRLLYKWISNPQSTFNTDTSGDAEASLPGRPQNQSLPPPLIDASVLLANPSATIEHICERTGIPFDPAMLSWDAKPQAEFAKWGAYHQGAENSTGFQAEKKKDDQEMDESKRLEEEAAKRKAELEKIAKLPIEVRNAIERNMEPYNWLVERQTTMAL